MVCCIWSAGEVIGIRGREGGVAGLRGLSLAANPHPLLDKTGAASQVQDSADYLIKTRLGCIPAASVGIRLSSCLISTHTSLCCNCFHVDGTDLLRNELFSSFVLQLVS
jgi:hypothetical protein